MAEVTLKLLLPELLPDALEPLGLLAEEPVVPLALDEPDIELEEPEAELLDEAAEPETWISWPTCALRLEVSPVKL